MPPLFVALAPLVVSQVPFQLADIDDRAAGSQISALSGTGNRAYFAAFQAATGLELFTSDGTSAGTTLVADLTPGVASSTISWTFTAQSARAYVAANGQLYTSNGSAVGTTVLVPTTTDTFVALGATPSWFYFGRNTGTVTRLFRTDGTPGGTLELTNGQGTTLQPGARFGPFYFFFKNNRELWRSDGTNAGTVLVFDTGASALFPVPSMQVGSSLAYFTVGDSLYRTDGAAGVGTYLLRSFTALVPGAVLGNTLFFGGTGPNGAELWRSDGTVGTTAEFMDLTPGASSSQLVQFAANASFVLFLRGVSSPTPAAELWASNGTTVGTAVVATMNDFGGGVRRLSAPLASSGVVWATTTSLSYVSNGTPAGTQPVSVTLVNNTPLVAATDRFFFVGSTTSGVELLTSNGSPAATLTRDLYVGTTSFGGPQRSALSLDRTFLWLNGAGSSTVVGLDGRPGAPTRVFFGGSTGPYGTVGSSALVSANSEPVLAPADGGLRPLGDVSPGTATTVFRPATSIDLGGSTVFVAASVPSGGIPPYDFELFRTDGTVAGTTPLLDLRPGTVSSGITRFERVGSSAYFNANDGVAGDELWITDGTVMGTRRVADVNAGVGSSSPSSITAFRDGVLFVANDGTSGAEPWYSDGTPAGTRRVSDTVMGSLGLTGFGGFCVAPALGAAFFVANGALYETDGTPGGTRVVGAAATSVACAGDRVVAIRDGGVEVFDGVSTARLAPPVTSGLAQDVVGVGTSAFIRADAPSTGTELWRLVDGGASLAALAQVGPGALDGVQPLGAFQTFRMRDRLVFFGSIDGYDFEPWGFPIDGTPPSVTPLVAGTLGQNGWYTSNVGVSFTVSEPDTRLASRNCQNVTVSTDTPGTTITCVAVSEGGETVVPVTFKRDATPPVFTLTAPAMGSVTNQRRPQLGGTASERARLDARTGATTWCTTSADAGTIACAPTTDLPTGSNTVTFTLTDEAGNVSTAVDTTFTIDVTAPATPAISSPAANARVRVLTFSGTAEAGATVRVLEGGALLCSAVADGSGAWTCTASMAGAERTLVIEAEARDAAGNVSGRSGMVTITLDLTPPLAPVITMPAPNAQLGVSRPTVSGTCEANAHVSIFVDGSTSPDCETDGPSGTFSCQLASALSNGAHSVTAVARDLAGNQSAPSNSVPFTVSTTVPPAPVITVPASMAFVRDVRPTFSGTGLAGLQLRVSIDGAMVPACTTTVDAMGAWRCGATAALAEGPHTAVAIATDAFTTDSPPSMSVSFTIDVTAPASPVITQPASGSTTGLRPTFAGTAAASVGVLIFVDGASTATCTLTSTAAGTFSCAPPADLAAGPHSVQAKAVDQAGNESPLSGVVLFTVQSTTDTRPPTLTCPRDIEAQASAGGSAIVNFQATVTDDLDLSPSLRYSQAPGTDFVEGDTQVLVTATDASGNTSQCQFLVKVSPSSERNTVRSGCRCSGVGADAFLSAAGVVLLLARSRRRGGSRR